MDRLYGLLFLALSLIALGGSSLTFVGRHRSTDVTSKLDVVTLAYIIFASWILFGVGILLRYFGLMGG